jgi:hypothetical protein
MDMTTSRRPPRPSFESHSAIALALAALIVTAGFWPGVHGIVSAQEPNPCALLTDDDLKSVAAPESSAVGVSSAAPSYGYSNCRYGWGEGNDRLKLVVSVSDAARIFPGMTPDQIKQRLLESVKAGTNDTVVSEVGDAAMFKPDSFVYAVATAFVKGRILQVQLDGLGAVEKKDQVIGLLKSAASRL